MARDKIGFSHASYEGGLAAYPHVRRGVSLWFTPDAIGVGVLHPKRGVVPLGDVAAYDTTGGVEARSRAMAVAAVGVLGLARRSQTNVSTIQVRTRKGENAMYVVENMSSAKVQAQVVAWMSAHKIPKIAEVPVPSAAPVSAADELRKLADLLARGAITGQEYAVLKARLLGT